MKNRFEFELTGLQVFGNVNIEKVKVTLDVEMSDKATESAMTMYGELLKSLDAMFKSSL